ncbi:DUF6986 family protein, partial [Kocuria arenosa]|uniref:DUF6986 family protein n=1 Tax=Kocuria arenosa TaxID=3071446 RepID=UPI003F664B31
LLPRSYPGDPGTRQPVHTVYLPADSFTPETARQWGERAARSVAGLGAASLAEEVAPEGADPGLVDRVARAVEHKLATEPIEDVRLDFEDGFGDRGDQEEDEWAVRAARTVALAVREGTAPPYIGIRFKCFEAATRDRGLRTLDLFPPPWCARGGCGSRRTSRPRATARTPA